MAVAKGANVADIWDNSRGEGAWNPTFVRPFNDWEIEEVQNFMCLVNTRRVKQEENDRLFWKGDKKGMYTVRANASLLEGDANKTAPVKILWNGCVPPKVYFFAWEVW